MVSGTCKVCYKPEIGFHIRQLRSPCVQGTQGDYVDAVRDTYSIPDGIFTEALERVHARLAMVGLGGLVALELIFGRAIL
jgi:hypothetical protein